MKLELKLTKNNSPIYQGTYVVTDAESFGNACSDLWEKLTAKKIANASSIGALYDTLSDSMAVELNGAQIHLRTVGS